MKKFTIITICLNIGHEIGDTIASVLRQTSSDFEYIIKDGISKDNTVSVAESFIPAFAERGIPYRILSQADSGVYDAMNQATAEAKGEWVIYMNAGDKFADQTVLEQVEKSGCLEKADIVYGDRIVKNQDMYRYAKAYTLDAFEFGLPFGHQSVFTRREILGTAPYAVEYKISSDYKCFLRFYRDRKHFSYLPIPICIYDINGISSNLELRYQENIRMLEEMPERDAKAIESIERQKRDYRRYRMKMWLHKHLFRYIPKEWRLKRRQKMKRNDGWKTKEEFFGEKKDNT